MTSKQKHSRLFWVWVWNHFYRWYFESMFFSSFCAQNNTHTHIHTRKLHWVVFLNGQIKRDNDNDNIFSPVRFFFSSSADDDDFFSTPQLPNQKQIAKKIRIISNPFCHTKLLEWTINTIIDIYITPPLPPPSFCFFFSRFLRIFLW